MSGTFFCVHENISTAFFRLPLIQEEQLSVELMAKECTLSTVLPGKLSLGGLPMNSVVRITDCLDLTSAFYRGRTATNQTNIKTC